MGLIQRGGHERCWLQDSCLRQILRGMKELQNGSH